MNAKKKHHPSTEQKRNSTMKRILFFVLSCLMALTLLTGCSSTSGKTCVYALENGEWELKMKISEKDEDEFDFLITATTGGTPWGYVTGDEEPNYRIVFNEGTESEAMYELIVNIRDDTVAYIEPDLFADESSSYDMREVYISYTSALNFYDFVS